MLNGKLEKGLSGIQMSVESEPIIPVQVKYVEAQSAEILRNPKTTLRISKSQESPLDNDVYESPRCSEELADTSIMSPNANSNNSMTSNTFQFDPNLSYAEKVAHEMIITEKIYLDNLKQIIDGFLGPVSNHPNLDVIQKNIDDLFINVEEIYNFNWILLKDMEQCNYDPVKLAKCFVVKQTGFDVYTRYCTHYPRSMEVLMEWNQREDTASFIKRQQETLGHTLPLCSFLLKPVQRILKYHLLLGNIAKHYKQSEDEEGFQVIQKALSAMTNVAKHINSMKRKHEDAVHLQEIQSVLVEYEGPNLTTFGSLVLEDAFRLHGTKTDRYLFLFKKALLITKRRSDGTFTWKATVMHSNMMLADSVFREPLTFQVFPFDDRKMFYTFVARNMDKKQVWLLELKRRLLDSYTAAVPMKAKEIILGKSRGEYEKENAEPENDHKLVTNNTRKGANQQRTQTGKDNSSNKLNKGIENGRKKTKEFEENSEEKSRTSIDSIKSPLRRKLRVFKKRKFSKDQLKSPKRVSWSSDDNNEEANVGPTVSQNEGLEKQNVAISNTPLPPAIFGESDCKLQDIQDEDIEEEVEPRAEMVAVSVEDPNLRGIIESLPIKKRRLTKEYREKSKSMPVGSFPSGGDGERALKNRAQSMSKLYEQFTEEELLSNHVSAKELQNKYGLVNLRENAANIRTRRLGSFDDQMASIEGCLRLNSEVNNLTDEVMSKLADDTTVNQTMKCVSAAFSDISPSFSPEKTPTSSTEDLIAPESDEFGMFEDEQRIHGDIIDHSLREKETENKTYSNHPRDEESEGVWDHLEIIGDSASPLSYEDNNELHSNDDKSSVLCSEQSSYTETLSDFCDDEDTHSLTNSVKGTFQKVFSLKRAYSEENLVSKYSLNKTEHVDITSKSCTHFEQKHFPVARSKSMGSSHRLPSSHSLTFSVTPKKKIVIKDSLWETIKEDPHERSMIAKDGHAVRRRRRTSPNTHSWSSGESSNTPIRFTRCVSLDIGDYRNTNGEQKRDLTSDKQFISEIAQKDATPGVEQAERDTELGRGQGIAGKSVTKVEVAVKIRSNKPKKEKSAVLRVDANVSEAPRNINYLCVEKFPPDEHVSNDENTNGTATEECARLDSKVETLSKYFSKPEESKSVLKSGDTSAQNVGNIMKRIEELKENERTQLTQEERPVVSDEFNLQRIRDRIDKLQQFSQEERQTPTKLKAELENTHKARNVKRLKNRIEDNDLQQVDTYQMCEVELGNQLQSKLRIKDRVDEMEHIDVNGNTSNRKLSAKVDEELCACKCVKDRIETLQKGNDKEIDNRRDITISDEKETTLMSSPRQNEELRTVVIKRGWVQQFVQKIETGS